MNDELLELALAMHQDLQEYVDAGEESGSNMDATKGLLAEWDTAYQKTQRWQDMLPDDGSIPEIKL